MVTLDGMLQKYYDEGKISREDALTKCQDPITQTQKVQEIDDRKAAEEAMEGGEGSASAAEE